MAAGGDGGRELQVGVCARACDGCCVTTFFWAVVGHDSWLLVRGSWNDGGVPRMEVSVRYLILWFLGRGDGGILGREPETEIEIDVLGMFWLDGTVHIVAKGG